MCPTHRRGEAETPPRERATARLPQAGTASPAESICHATARTGLVGPDVCSPRPLLASLVKSPHLKELPEAERSLNTVEHIVVRSGAASLHSPSRTNAVAKRHKIP